ncbi:MAG: hypothetical protein J6K25_14670 [Thermoguttaceae bacterium]|nr:hypothetical protein [Thermoguttaceae bacterium]
MTRRATLSGVSVCVAVLALVASVASVVGNELDGVRADAATRFLDGGEIGDKNVGEKSVDATDGVSDGNDDATSPTEPIRIENFTSGEAVSYSVALLRGTAPGVERGTVVVENLSSSRPTRVTRAPVVAGRFKVLVELVPGENRLTPAVGESRIDFLLTRRPDDNPRFVRLIYFVDSTGDETFATPDFWTNAQTEITKNGNIGGKKAVLTGGSKAAGAAEVERVAQDKTVAPNEAVKAVAPGESSAESARTAEKTSNNFRAKIGTAALLWQTATAERLNDAGYGRRTFSLELDEAGDPVVWVLRGEKTAAEYAALSETERFRAIYREIEASNLANELARYFVSVAFARKLSETEAAETGVAVDEGAENSETAQNRALAAAKKAEEERIKAFLTISTIGAPGKTTASGDEEATVKNTTVEQSETAGQSGTAEQDRASEQSGATGKNGAVGGIAERGKPGSTWARVALGGGSVAALDASTLFSWPDSLVDVADAFADARPISEDFAADSGFRRTRWALTASTLGAGLHELGHAFGLDHSPESTDFMSRGFDRFNRIFTVVEPPDANSPNAVESVFDDESAATWTPESANRLIRSRWIEK